MQVQNDVKGKIQVLQNSNFIAVLFDQGERSTDPNLSNIVFPRELDHQYQPFDYDAMPQWHKDTVDRILRGPNSTWATFKSAFKAAVNEKGYYEPIRNILRDITTITKSTPEAKDACETTSLDWILTWDHPTVNRSLSEGPVMKMDAAGVWGRNADTLKPMPYCGKMDGSSTAIHSACVLVPIEFKYYGTKTIHHDPTKDSKSSGGGKPASHLAVSADGKQVLRALIPITTKPVASDPTQDALNSNPLFPNYSDLLTNSKVIPPLIGLDQNGESSPSEAFVQMS